MKIFPLSVQHFSLDRRKREKNGINGNMAFQENACSITECVVTHGFVTLFNQTKAWMEVIPIK